jgi:molecular chaperone HscB
VPLQNKNYFQIFSIPESFQLDLEKLSSDYRAIQAQVHPDRFANGSENEKLNAIQSTSLLNAAYETLASPQKRAAYLLQLQDIDVNKVDQADLSPGLLMEQIQLRERLEEIPRDESALGELDSMRKSIQNRITSSQTSFAESYHASNLDLAKKSYYELQYFSKLISEIEAIEEDLLGY